MKNLTRGRGRKLKIDHECYIELEEVNTPCSCSEGLLTRVLDTSATVDSMLFGAAHVRPIFGLGPDEQHSAYVGALRV